MVMLTESLLKLLIIFCCHCLTLFPSRAASSAEFGHTIGTIASGGGDPFGDTVVWEDAGEEGLVPRKISSPAAAAASPVRTVSSPQQQVG